MTLTWHGVQLYPYIFSLSLISYQFVLQIFVLFQKLEKFVIVVFKYKNLQIFDSEFLKYLVITINNRLNLSTKSVIRSTIPPMYSFDWSFGCALCTPLPLLMGFFLYIWNMLYTKRVGPKNLFLILFSTWIILMCQFIDRYFEWFSLNDTFMVFVRYVLYYLFSVL